MAELERLLAAPARDELSERHLHGKWERDRLLLASFAYAGLRRSELLGLAWDDVDLSRRLLYVRRAKGGRQGVVPIHPALAPLFATYYATRVPLTEQADHPRVQHSRTDLVPVLCGRHHRVLLCRFVSAGPVTVPEVGMARPRAVATPLTRAHGKIRDLS
jgi:integrase